MEDRLGRRLFITLWLPVLIYIDISAQISTQFKIDSWGIEQGLKSNIIWAMEQTQDGYLWLATESGLSRFDGFNFHTFDKTNTPAMRTHFISSLVEDKEGTLWIGSRGGGLLIRSNGRFRQFHLGGQFKGNIVTRLCRGRDGTVWIATFGNGLYRYLENRLTHYTMAHSLPGNQVTAIFPGELQGIWIGTTSGLALLKEDRCTHYPIPGPLQAQQVHALLQNERGVWIGTSAGLYIMKHNRIDLLPLETDAPPTKINAVFQDKKGIVWVGTRNQGLFRWVTSAADKQGTFENVSKPEWLGRDRVYSILEDKHGSIWTGMMFGGLNRVKPMEIQSLGDGNQFDTIVLAVYREQDNRFWLGTYNGLIYMNNHIRETVTTRNGLSSDLVFAVYRDRRGGVWVGTEKGLNRLNPVSKPMCVEETFFNTNVRAIGEDDSGHLWVGTDVGLFKRSADGEFEKKLDGVINTFHFDNGSGMWVSTYGNGIVRYDVGKITRYDENAGLAGNLVKSFYQDKQGAVWVTTDKGLSRVFNGSVQSFTTAHGLFSNNIFQVKSDRQDNLWFSCDQGIFRIAKGQLDLLIQGGAGRVIPDVYGEAEGMRSRVCMDGFQSACSSENGTIYVATKRGVVIVDPDKLKTSGTAPRTSIEQVVCNEKILHPFTGMGSDRGNQPGILTIGREVKQIRFHYSALNLLTPEKTRFRYMLEGYEQQWVEAGNRRTAYYTNPGAGRYRFRVIASSGGGIWSSNPALLQIHIPSIWENPWFVTAMGIVSLILTALLIFFYKKYMRLSVFWRNRTYVGHYKLMEKIGTGGMGTVYKARRMAESEGREKYAAIKVLKEEFFEDDSIRLRFKRESEIIRQLDHPHIVKVYERGESNRSMYIAMELLDGITLAERIESGGLISLSECLTIMKQTAGAVAEIHNKQFVHRDLKPGNIMLIHKAGEPPYIKLLDFGLARYKLQSRLTQTGVVIGTINYMAPEQLTGAGYAEAADIYAMGVMFSEMLSGEKAFLGENSIETLMKIMQTPPKAPILSRPETPPALNNLIVRMTAKQDHQRPSIVEVCDTLIEIENQLN